MPLLPPDPAAPGRRLATLARRVLPVVLAAGLLAVAAGVLHHELRQLQPGAIAAAVHGVAAGQLLAACALTALSFLALVGYEHFALGFAGWRLPARTTALGATVAQSIAHTTGFAAVVATGLRYRVYRPCGLDLVDIAKVQGFFVFTFCLGLVTLFGAALLLLPQYPARLLPLPIPLWVWRSAGALGLAVVAAYLVWSRKARSPLHILRQPVVPPGPGVTTAQIVLSFVDIGAAAAALWVLLPAELNAAYPAVLAMFLAAVILGIVSQVPGALGVLEGAMLLQLAAPPEATPAVLGALLVYRVIYYLLPFLVGCGLYAVHEGDAVRDFLRGQDRWRPRLRRWGPGAAAGALVIVLVVLLLRT